MEDVDKLDNIQDGDDECGEWVGTHTRVRGYVHVRASAYERARACVIACLFVIATSACVCVRAFVCNTCLCV